MAQPTRQEADRRAPQARTVRREAFLALEDSLAIRTFNSWRREVSPIIQKIADRFERGDVNGAFEAINELDLGPVAERQERLARFIGTSAVIFGATDFAAAENTVFARQRVPEVVDKAVNIFKFTLTDTNEAVRTAAKNFLQERLEGRVRKLVGTFAVDLGKRAVGTGSANILLASSLHASRLGSWGFTQEGITRGVQNFIVSEQLDIRTCPVCRQMHGKVFPMGPASAKLERWLGAENPKDLKNIATFPNQSKSGVKALRGMSTEALQGAGWDTPPYHPFCRGVLRKTNKRPTVGGVAPRGAPSTPVLPLGPITAGRKPPTAVPTGADEIDSFVLGGVLTPGDLGA